MPQVSAAVVLNLTPATAFAVSQTTGELRRSWDPFIRTQYLLDGASRPDRGVRTFTRARVGPAMVSRYTSYRPPTSVGMTMESGPWFFDNFGGGWRFNEHPAGCEAVWKYTFSTRPNWLSPAADRIGSALLGREIRARIAAFGRACADPEIVRRALAQAE